jgi:hypothetical protein
MWTRAKLGGGGWMRTFPTECVETPVGWRQDANVFHQLGEEVGFMAAGCVVPTTTAETYDASGVPACHFMGRRPGLFSRA